MYTFSCDGMIGWGLASFDYLGNVLVSGEIPFVFLKNLRAKLAREWRFPMHWSRQGNGHDN